MKRADVLVLDDEVHVLRAVQRALREVMGVEVQTTAHPRQAIALLAASPPKVLITDFRMPGINGVEVLREARRLAPDTVRILLTAHADRENVIEAVNAGKIFRYIAKPWDNRELADVVREALQSHAAHCRGRNIKEAVDYVAELQRSVLSPGRLHVLDAEAAACFRPCEQAGGDYVDTMVLPSQRTALMLGDVSGHGLGAALFVFTARALLRSGFAEGQPLPEVFVRTNRFLCRDMNAGRFITLFVAVHDARRKTLRYVNAGQMSPIIARADGLVELPRTALPLGIQEAATYDDVREIPFGPDDTLFTCSDGLIEARNDDRELFGEDRVKDLLRETHDLPPEALIARIRVEYRAFTGSSQADDDLSLLAYRPTPVQVAAVAR